MRTGSSGTRRSYSSTTPTNPSSTIAPPTTPSAWSGADRAFRGLGVGAMIEESLFAAALERSTAAERRAFLDEACAGDVALRQRVERLLAAHEKTLGILDQLAGPPEIARSHRRVSSRRCLDGRTRRRPGGRPLQAARSDRRRGHGHGLGGRADAAGAPQGGPEAHQGRHGLEVRPGALRGRAAGAGPDGPPQHRQGARRRH